MNDAQSMSKTVDLVYSPDDGGYYFHDLSDHSVSITYSTESDARMAWVNDSVEWEGI